ncbi:hypothetical protein Avbf_08475 [Armadillidium vulgare]|nr:hypothetical protein Avbf_08475 [Armadillidium vulgare]
MYTILNYSFINVLQNDSESSGVVNYLPNGPRLGLEAKKKGIPIEVSKRILKTTIQYCGEDP